MRVCRRRWLLLRGRGAVPASWPARFLPGGRGSAGTYALAMRVLLTGMSGAGKSALVRELRRRGYAAYDADDDGFSEPRDDGRWGWRSDAVASLLAQVAQGELLFFAGCSEEQIEMPFDYRVLLTVPQDEMVMRLRTRTSNAYGRTPAERSQVLADLTQIEPLLRRRADLVLSTTAPVAEVADRLLAHAVDRAAGIT
jgi:AAA domain